MIKAVKKQAGLALLTVLLVLALLSTMIAYAFDEQFLLVRRVTNQKLLEQSYQLSMGAEEWVKNVLYRDLENPDTARVDHFAEDWNNLEGTVAVEQGSLNVQAIDLTSRFNLNSLSSDSPAFETAVWIFNNLLLQLELDTRLTGNLVDWIDADDNDLPRPGRNRQQIYIGGAEDNYYTGLDRPYRAANQPLSSLGDLRMIKGFDDKAIRKLSPYVSALPSKELRINLNTVSPELLQSMVREFAITPPSLGEIIERRTENPLEDTGLITQSAGDWAPSLGNYVTVNSPYFLVISEASFGDLRYSMRSVLYRQLEIESDGRAKPIVVLKRERVLL